MSEQVLQMLKAMAWEDAKGKLRALSGLAAHNRIAAATVEQERATEERWLKLDRSIEAFISDIENEGLQE